MSLKCLKVDEGGTEKRVKSVNSCSPYCFTSTEFHRQKILQNSCTKSYKYYTNVKKLYKCLKNRVIVLY